MAPPKSDKWVRRFEVTDPRKHSKGFTVYKVTSVIFPKGAPEASTRVIVWKRYNDFKKLHSKLKLYHKNCKISEEFPKLSKAKYFKRFEDDVIKERVECALVLLNFIGKHQALFTCDPFLHFFENGYHFPDYDQDKSPELLDNGNVSPTEDPTQAVQTYKIINGERQNNCLLHLSGTWDAPLVSETISVNSRSSDDDSFVTSDTTESVCSVSSPAERAEDVEDPAMNCRMTQSVTQSRVTPCDAMTRSTSSLEVTCHSEKPIKPSEMWLSVRTQDFRLGTYDTADAWLSPPGTPADLQPQDYIVEAAYHVGQAQNYEVSGEYEAAFSFYKAAIACLLSGVHDDQDPARRQAVRDKTSRYLQRAEKIYTMYLSSEKTKAPPPSITDLKTYKVLGIIDKAMLVLNTQEDKCYVIKVLEKSPCPVDTKRKTVIPRNVPYMVQLVKYYENESSVFLVLQYASGGRLWDHITNYLQSIPSTPVKTPQNLSYTGKKLHESEFDFPAYEAEAESQVESEDKGSYLELIRNYTASTAKKIFGYGESEPEVKSIPESILRSESHVIFDKEALMEPLPVPVEEVAEPLPDVVQQLKVVDQDVLEDTPEVKDRWTSLEVTDLVEHSQKLLESVNRTLQQSETVTCSLSQELESMESVFQTPGPEPGLERVEQDQRRESQASKKRSTSALPRPRFERRFSDDLLETRSRTASNSLDRCGQWSRLASMVSTKPRLPEQTIRGWAAELLVAIETLHRWGVICKDLHPDNLLLGDHGHLLLTFQSQWREVDSLVSEVAVRSLHAAPETRLVFPVTAAADWWSYGALLYHLITGSSLSAAHSSGIYSHTLLTFPEFVSPEARSLLSDLLRFEPGDRLGGGSNGSDDVKNHPFFASLDWQSVYDCLAL